MGHKETVNRSEMPLHISQPKGWNIASFADLTSPRPRLPVPTSPNSRSPNSRAHGPTRPRSHILTRPRVPRPQTRVPVPPSPSHFQPQPYKRVSSLGSAILKPRHYNKSELFCQIRSVVEMAFPTSAYSVLLAPATLFSIAVISGAKLAQGLYLDKYSEEQVKGCYIHNQTLGVFFDVRKGFMKMTKSTGEEIGFKWNNGALDRLILWFCNTDLYSLYPTSKWNQKSVWVFFLIVICLNRVCKNSRRPLIIV